MKLLTNKNPAHGAENYSFFFLYAQWFSVLSPQSIPMADNMTTTPKRGQMTLTLRGTFDIFLLFSNPLDPSSFSPPRGRAKPGRDALFGTSRASWTVISEPEWAGSTGNKPSESPYRVKGHVKGHVWGRWRETGSSFPRYHTADGDGGQLERV